MMRFSTFLKGKVPRSVADPFVVQNMWVTINTPMIFAYKISNICSFIDTNLIHNFLYKLHKIKFLYMFRASSPHLREVNDVNCTCMQPLVFSFSVGGRLVHLLRGDR